MDNKILIGLTGSFGSGCSSLREVLSKQPFGFQTIKLSTEVRKEAKKRKSDPEDRQNLQNLGNILRKEKGTNYLAIKALEKVKNGEGIVFHGLRNIGEVNEFRQHPNFYLVAVDCSKENRWDRLKDKIYNNDQTAFDRDDLRDKNDGLEHGQQVLKCVEEADILFINDDNYDTSVKKEAELRDRFNPYFGLITNKKLRNPSISETMMTAASTLALQSHCIKRRVGSVLCDSSGYIISAAYNEVPKGQEKCSDKYRMCYRDFFRKELNKKTLDKYEFCPFCSEKLDIDKDYKCRLCKKDLISLIPPYKALDKCRSLHAEETTILKTAHYQINDSTLYTTTFPCLQCTKRILHSGIKNVVYIDPYPEKESIVMIEKSRRVTTEKFEGVKAQAYYKLFHPQQKSLEKKTEKNLKNI